MAPIRKKIVTDEQMLPIAVQIDYASWLEIERRLGLEVTVTEMEATKRTSLQQLADEIRPHWQGGDGLAYQRSIREEWTRPWDPEAREEA